MMQAHIVTVESHNGRYTDSIWIELKSADRRCAEIVAEFARRRLGTYTAWVTECTIQDAEIGSKKGTV